MDPIVTPALLGIATNLVSSALWDVLRDPAFGSGLQGDPYSAHMEAIDEAVQELEPVLSAVTSEDRATVEHFLNSPDVRALVSTMYRSRAADPHRSQLQLRQAFAAAWGTRAGEHVHCLSAYEMFDAL